jgi:glycosyltransferase involved in cell wall biosynthesis
MKITHSCHSFFKKKFPKIVGILYYLHLYFLVPISVFREGSKNVLICYLTKPFSTENHRNHSNQKEVIVMANVLHDLGFSVDAVDFNSQSNIDYSKYDLLIGFGSAFSNSFVKNSFAGKRILHMTGANLNFSNGAEALRAYQLKKRKGVLLAPKREVYWPWMFSAINSEAIFVLGNSWTVSTYEKLNNNLFMLPVPFVEPKLLNFERDFKKKNKNFCWFAGSGALHKGLDLLLDAMELLDSKYHLDVCGPIEQEEDFLKLYKNSIYSDPRVKFHGFIDVISPEMELIMASNCFVIFPSCSEGGGSSVITCMSAGLIPIVTEEASVDIGSFGVLIESASVESIAQSMVQASEICENELHERSRKASLYAKEYHSFEAYKRELEKAVIRVVGN